ncbi:transglycosylase domain-containing protein [Streptomyces sp. NPDC005438]|uniref:transglycosylase domain-containing protein n=1 Tax=Streptomyces sp. NPDC005438 TaxID=3156880 RepID=UPI0033BC66DA
MTNEPNGSAEPADEGETTEAPGAPDAAPTRAGWRRAVPTWRMVLGAFMLLALVITGGFVTGYLLVEIPPPNSGAAAESNVYLYSDGSQLARDGEVNRESVKLAQVPRKVQHAVLAAEDRDFHNESAIDLKAMLRAGWNMVTGGGKQSGSTITQQYVKNYYLDQDQTLTRKGKEFFIAIKLDREVSKNEILEGYLNTSYFGRNAYGIQSAAQAYYGKDAEDLTAAQGAYLAALVNSPNAYDISAHPENRKRAEARWHYVLDGMVKEGWLSESARKKAKFPVPQEAKPSTGLSGQRGYLVEAIKNHLFTNDIIDERRLARGGFRITTTLQPSKQKALEKAVDKRLMDKLSKDRKVDRYVRAGGTSIDPKSGKVVAMYGGIDYTKQYVNNATRRDYQVGSTFKPFIFTSAVENKSSTQDGQAINANTVYDGTNKREVVNDGRGTGYAPENEDHRSYGPIPVTTAMDKSVNSVFAQMGVDVGPQKVKDTAISLGVPKNTPNMPADGSLALGVATASTLDMAKAYATLANHGEHPDYSLVQKITRGGEVVRVPRAETKRAVDRGAADATTAILRSVVQGGTGTAAQAAGRPAAGKTGTAEEDRAAWFAGYTPELATVVSVMGQDPKSGQHKPLYGAAGLPRVNGGGFPAEIWGDYTAAALRGKPVKEFDLKSGTNPGDPSASPPPNSASPPPGEDPSQPPPETGGPPTSNDPTVPPPSTPPTNEPSTPDLPTNGGLVGGGDNGGDSQGQDGGVEGNTNGGLIEGPGVRRGD